MNFSDEDRLFKLKNRYVIYSIRKRPSSRRVVFVFSGVDATSTSCRMSYYGLREQLNATVVHVMDNFGAHGCYLLSMAGDQQIRNVVLSLIKNVKEELGLTSAESYFIGTSKGGSSAVAFSLMSGGGTVIAGEPQIRLGDFIYQPRWETLEQFRALAYAITGRVSPEEDRERLNHIILDIMDRYGPTYRGRMVLHYGDNTGYWPQHIEHLVEAARTLGIGDRIQLVRHAIDRHNDIVPIFLDAATAMFPPAGTAT